VCFRGGKAPTRRNLGAASLFSFVMARDADWLADGPRKLSEAGLPLEVGLGVRPSLTESHGFEHESQESREPWVRRPPGSARVAGLPLPAGRCRQPPGRAQARVGRGLPVPPTPLSAAAARAAAGRTNSRIRSLKNLNSSCSIAACQ
jgi:hypothetical protein